MQSLRCTLHQKPFSHYIRTWLNQHFPSFYESLRRYEFIHMYIHTTLSSLIFMNINNTKSTSLIKQLTYIYKLYLEPEYLIIKITALKRWNCFVCFFHSFLMFFLSFFFLKCECMLYSIFIMCTYIKYAYRDTINNWHVGKLEHRWRRLKWRRWCSSPKATMSDSGRENCSKNKS